MIYPPGFLIKRLFLPYAVIEAFYEKERGSAAAAAASGIIRTCGSLVTDIADCFPGTDIAASVTALDTSNRENDYRCRVLAYVIHPVSAHCSTCAAFYAKLIINYRIPCF